MTDYEKGYRAGLVFATSCISNRVLGKNWVGGWYKVIHRIFDDIEAQLKRMNK